MLHIDTEQEADTVCTVILAELVEQGIVAPPICNECFQHTNHSLLSHRVSQE